MRVSFNPRFKRQVLCTLAGVMWAAVVTGAVYDVAVRRQFAVTLVTVILPPPAAVVTMVAWLAGRLPGIEAAFEVGSQVGRMEAGRVVSLRR